MALLTLEKKDIFQENWQTQISVGPLEIFDPYETGSIGIIKNCIIYTISERKSKAIPNLSKIS